MGLLKWPGAKWSIGKKIVSLFPEHKIYVDAFVGSGATFFLKDPSCNEILNDLDGDIVNFFTCLRDKPEELAVLMALTPCSREEYKRSYDREGCSDLERARRFIIRCNMARAGMQYYSSAWRHAGPVRAAVDRQAVSGPWSRLSDEIITAAERLKDAEIEQTDALQLIEKYNHPDCLIYADPPYLLSTRRQRYYNVEMETDQQHEELLRTLTKHTGPVVLSGYDSDLYNDYLSSWARYEIDAVAEQGKKRTEIVWVNRADRQMSLSDYAAGITGPSD